MARNTWLILGGSLSALAAVLHLAVIAGGPSWYRLFGAGEEMARAAERGSATPALVTLAIAAILGIWSLYAFSGAGVIRRLPLLRTALVVISAVYLLRALALLPLLLLSAGPRRHLRGGELAGRPRLRTGLCRRNMDGLARDEGGARRGATR